MSIPHRVIGLWHDLSESLAQTWYYKLKVALSAFLKRYQYLIIGRLAPGLLVPWNAKPIPVGLILSEKVLNLWLTD
jgi:hypothetical protein